MGIFNPDIKDGYKNNPKLKPVGVTMSYTQEEMAEFIKCMHDPVYFCNTYVKVKTLDKGIAPFSVYPYQKRFIMAMHSNRFVISKWPRQSGKTTAVIGYFLHALIFNQSITAAILANKLSTAKELFARFKLGYENLPHFLQQGVLEWNKSTVQLENGSRIFCAATSSTAARGESINIILLDEYGFVPDSIAEEFYSAMYPTISAGTNTKLFIVSTPNGRNHFYKLWTDANRPDGHKLKNQFVPIEVRWQEVPITAGGRLRDEQWKKDQIANTSEDQFEQEYGCSFLGASNTLISSTTLGSLAAEDPITKGADGLHIFEPPKENHTYFLMADVSEGLGRDYSAFSVVDTHTTPYKVVATFRNNVINPVHLPEVIFSAGTAYNNAFVIVETNNIGIQVTNALHNDLEYENMVMTKQGGCKGQQLSAGFGDNQRSAIGIRTTAGTKRIGCTNLKHLIEERKLFVSDERIIGELMSFVARNNSYSADLGQNDDLVMTLVFFAWLTRQPYFNELIQEGRQAPDKVHTAEDDSVLFFAKSGEQEDNAPFVQGDCIWYPA